MLPVIKIKLLNFFDSLSWHHCYRRPFVMQ